MRVVEHHSEQVLLPLAERKLRADRVKRLRTVLLAKQGFTAPAIATCTVFSRCSVQEWVARDNTAGRAGDDIGSRSQATADARTNGTTATRRQSAVQKTKPVH